MPIILQFNEHDHSVIELCQQSGDGPLNVLAVLDHAVLDDESPTVTARLVGQDQVFCEIIPTELWQATQDELAQFRTLAAELSSFLHSEFSDLVERLTQLANPEPQGEGPAPPLSDEHIPF